MTMYEIISGKKTEAEREAALEIIKKILLKRTHKGSDTQKAINGMSIYNLPKNYGIFHRLSTDGYCAGQSYPDELRTIREIIKHQVHFWR